MSHSTLITDYLGYGVIASRPASPSTPTGCLAIYIASDTGETAIWNGASWVDLAAAASPMGGDLGGNFPNPTVKSVANVNTGTLSVAHGGTGASTLTTHGVLLGEGTSAIAATATLAAGQLLIGQSSADPAPETMSGDATIANTGALTLATVNSNTGTWGDATHVGAFTVDGKGRITAASNVTITGAAPSGSAGGDLGGTYPNPTVLSVANVNTGTLAAGNGGTGGTSLGDGIGLNSGAVVVDHQGTITLSGTTTGTITPAQGTADMLVNVGTAAGTIAIGSGLYNGQRLCLEILQGATAHTVGFDSTVAFGSTIASFTATGSAAARDYVQLRWNGTKWNFLGLAQGFA